MGGRDNEGKIASVVFAVVWLYVRVNDSLKIGWNFDEILAHMEQSNQKNRTGFGADVFNRYDSSDGNETEPIDNRL